MNKAEITVDVVRCLIAEQFPQWSGLPVQPVAAWDEQTRSTIDLIADEIDAAGALAVWESATAASWLGPDVWLHGDITGSNLVLRNGGLAGVIDFGCSAVGDPACDLAIAWTMFDGASRRRFVQSVDADDATWARARGWALWKALIAIPNRPPDDPARSGTRFGWRWDALGVVAQVIADFAGDGAHHGGV